MKFNIIQIKRRLNVFSIRPYKVLVQFEDGSLNTYLTRAPDSDLFFYSLNDSMEKDNRNPSGHLCGIRNLLITTYDFKDGYSYQKYRDLYKTGKVTKELTVEAKPTEAKQ